jgi:hypothetical protein
MDQLADLKNYHSAESNRMQWFYKYCVITITTSKTGELFHSGVKILRPHGGGEMLLIMDDSFPTAQMAENYGMELARDWIDENVK